MHLKKKKFFSFWGIGRESAQVFPTHQDNKNTLNQIFSSILNFSLKRLSMILSV